MKKVFGIACCFIALLLAGCFESPTKPQAPVVAVGSADSLFTVLIARVQSLSKTSTYQEASAISFVDLRDAFNVIIGSDAQNQKANMGYMVSAILCLNGNPKILKLADSLDAYFHALDSVNNPTPIMAKTLVKDGVIGLGKIIGVKTQSMALAQTKSPSFPLFITMSYIQGIIETELLPVIDNVVAAAVRLEGRSEMSVLMTIPDGAASDTVKINKGEIYFVDAYLRLLRVYANWMCAYNFDLYSPGTTNYSWIDSLYNMPADTGGQREQYSLSSDTLFHVYSYTGGLNSTQFVYRMLQYNFQRTGYLTLRSANHAKIKENLTSIPVLVKSGIASIRAESGAQTYDLVKISSILSMDSGLVDTRQQLMDQGVSASLADKFKSPESICDFVTQLLSGPYTFNETVDSTHINITVNLCAFLDKPVNDLKTLLPKFRWLNSNEWITKTETSRYSWRNATPTYSFSTYHDNTTVRIPASKIASTQPNTYGGAIYTLTTPFTYETTVDSNMTITPIKFIDDAGNDLDMQSLVDGKTFLPYFADYTFDGVFPNMTRQKWIDLIYQH